MALPSADSSPQRYAHVAVPPTAIPPGATGAIAVARQRFGYHGRLPPPETIRARRAELAGQLTLALGEGQAALERQRQSQRAQLEELQKQQKARFLLALDAQVKADEYALSKEHNEQLMRLQQEAQRKRAQLEQQATSLVLEFQQRKLEEEFYAQQRDIHRQHEELQSRLAAELQKLFAPTGAAPNEMLWAAPRVTPAHQLVRVSSEATRRVSSFQPISSHSAGPSMQLPVAQGAAMRRSVSCAAAMGAQASFTGIPWTTMVKSRPLTSPRRTLR